MTDMLRCGLIGLGMMGRNHARVLRELPDVELVVIAEKQGAPESVSQGIPVVPSIDEALDYGLDCAIIAVPTQGHEELALKCAEARVATLIEKPLSHSVESAERIKAAFDEAGVFGAVGHIERFNPAVLELKKKLDGGEIGEIFQIATRRQSLFPGRISDVGVIKDLGSHDIDLVMAITGEKYVDVKAVTTHRSGRANEDMMLAIGQLESGIIVNHVVNWLSPMKERVTVVTGETGILIADTLVGDLTLHRNGEFLVDWDSFTTFRGVSEGDVIKFAFPKVEPLKAELKAFFEAVRGYLHQWVPTLGDGLEVLRVAEQINSQD